MDVPFKAGLLMSGSFIVDSWMSHSYTWLIARKVDSVLDDSWLLDTLLSRASPIHG